MLEFLRLLQPNEQQAQEIFKNIFVLNRLKLSFKEQVHTLLGVRNKMISLLKELDSIHREWLKLFSPTQVGLFLKTGRML